MCCCPPVCLLKCQLWSRNEYVGTQSWNIVIRALVDLISNTLHMMSVRPQLLSGLFFNQFGLYSVWLSDSILSTNVTSLAHWKALLPLLYFVDICTSPIPSYCLSSLIHFNFHLIQFWDLLIFSKKNQKILKCAWGSGWIKRKKESKNDCLVWKKIKTSFLKNLNSMSWYDKRPSEIKW